MIRKLIAGAVVAGGVTIGLSLPAFATPCYVGCTPGPVEIVGSGPSVPPGFLSSQSPHVPVPAQTQAAPAPGLPFTGADIEQSVAVASVLLVAGGVLVRRQRRRAPRAS